MSYIHGTAQEPGKVSQANPSPKADEQRTQSQDTKPPKVALYQKLLSVMEECGYIQKDKQNAYYGYRYTSEAAIKDKLHNALVKNRLLFLPSISDLSERLGLGKDGKDALTIIRIHFRFIDTETGECEEGEFFGTGIDAADKGTYKAVTGAIKYILTSWFLIPTGDDPEAPAAIEPDKNSTQAYPNPRPPMPEYKRPASAVPSQPHLPELPPANQLNEHFAKLRETVGEAAFVDVLSQFGVTHPKQLKTLKESRECYKRLLAIAKQSEAA
jgi:hypothetical protein